MGRLYDLLMKDYRLKEGLNACINCGTCTAICPAAEFYRYDPRRIVDIVQSKDDEEIEKLLKSDTIWYCGEVWEWEEKHLDDVFERLGGNLDGEGPGAMRRIPQEDLDQLKRIFDETGATERMEKVRAAGSKKAAEMGLTEDEFIAKIYTDSDPKHLNQ